MHAVPRADISSATVASGVAQSAARGAGLGFEDTPPLRVYNVEFVDGQVVVDTDAAIPRTEEEADRLVAPPSTISANADV